MTTCLALVVALPMILNQIQGHYRSTGYGAILITAWLIDVVFAVFSFFIGWALWRGSTETASPDGRWRTTRPPRTLLLATGLPLLLAVTEWLLYVTQPGAVYIYLFAYGRQIFFVLAALSCAAGMTQALFVWQLSKRHMRFTDEA
jgi:hypothetical protein